MFQDVSIDGRFQVRVWRAGAGRPLLFLHGFEGHPGDAPFLTDLAQRHQLIAPEMPGFSGSMQGASDLQDIVDYALFYRRFIAEQVGGPVDLIGHDLGGMLAAEVAAFSPHLVRRLVLVDAYGLWLDEHEIPDVFVQPPDALRELLWAQPERVNAAEPAGEDRATTDPATRALNAQQDRAIAAKFLWAVPERGLAKRLRYVEAPTLLVWGERDRLIAPDYAQAFQRQLANAEVALIADAGHVPMLEQPEAFLRTVERFLA
ncbi:MAG TPA: alpha/beta hydrolase [Dehalococcoidia bacterium]|nr:alpha/beta hydrolase [Dehalococcoidia bacterium]